MKKILKGNKSYRNLIRKMILIWVVICLSILTYKVIKVSNCDVQNPTFEGAEDGAVVEMIDVANGDAFLILQDDKAMLVDTGFITTYSSVRKTLEKWNVQKLDYVILTHPHRDHAGGFIKLIFDYHIDNIVIGDYPTTSIMDKAEKCFFKIYKASLKLATYLGDNIYYAQNTDGTFNDFELGDSKVHFIGPISSNYDKYEEINNYSLVFKLTYGNAKMLFTGDMEKLNERELLASGEDLKADILKVAHHGSYSSSSRRFLEAVNPIIAMVSADNGNGNLYGHPGISLVTKLKDMEVPLYRTDEQGNEVVKLKERSINYGKTAGDYMSGTELYASEQSRIK